MEKVIEDRVFHAIIAYGTRYSVGAAGVGLEADCKAAYFFFFHPKHKALSSILFEIVHEAAPNFKL
jgi:hypothetical protein